MVQRRGSRERRRWAGDIGNGKVGGEKAVKKVGGDSEKTSFGSGEAAIGGAYTDGPPIG